MSTNYPASLDTTANLINSVTDATLSAVAHAQAHNNVSDSVIAVETELGVNPSGTYATVAAFLAGLDTGTVKLSPAAAQIIVPTGDTVALVVKSANAANVSNSFESRLADNTIVAFIDHLGNFSAQAFKINGTLLNSTHLSDSASLARLASPAFTGTPTAPTPASTDSSTKIATTAYVQSAGGLPIGGVIDWPYAAAGIPSWSALTYGQAISRSTYSLLNALASAAVYPHGSGDGSTTFNLPDYRGRIGVGKDDMGGTAASRITTAISGFNGGTLGAVGGAEGITLTTAQIPAHNHGMTGAPSLSGAPTLSDPGHNHPGYNDESGGLGNDGLRSTDVGGTGSIQASNPTSNHSTGITISAGSLAVGVGTLGTSNTGSGSTHRNTQPSIIVNKIIRIQ